MGLWSRKFFRKNLCQTSGQAQGPARRADFSPPLGAGLQPCRPNLRMARPRSAGPWAGFGLPDFSPADSVSTSGVHSVRATWGLERTFSKLGPWGWQASRSTAGASPRTPGGARRADFSPPLGAGLQPGPPGLAADPGPRGWQASQSTAGASPRTPGRAPAPQSEAWIPIRASKRVWPGYLVTPPRPRPGYPPKSSASYNGRISSTASSPGIG
jgi:hypothetical protein